MKKMTEVERYQALLFAVLEAHSTCAKTLLLVTELAENPNLSDASAREDVLGLLRPLSKYLGAKSIKVNILMNELDSHEQGIRH